MDSMTLQKPVGKPGKKTNAPAGAKTPTRLDEHIIEIISDSGEGAQKCGQSLGSIAAQMGNGIWTTEIIPAEIRPPARSVAGASGNRIRIGSGRITNGGDKTDLVVAFNEQVLLGRVRAKELKPDCIILLESMWRTGCRHGDRCLVRRDVRAARRCRLSGVRNPDGAGVPQARRRCQARQEHVRAGHPVPAVQPGPEARASTRSSSPSARRTRA